KNGPKTAPLRRDRMHHPLRQIPKLSNSRILRGSQRSSDKPLTAGMRISSIRLRFRGSTRSPRMLRKKKERKPKSIALSLMRDVQGTATEKLRMFERVRAAGGFAKEDPAQLAEAFAAMEKGSG